MEVAVSTSAAWDAVHASTRSIFGDGATMGTVIGVLGSEAIFGSRQTNNDDTKPHRLSNLCLCWRSNYECGELEVLE